MIPRWAERYIGLPFVDKGRDLSGLDCWGLVRIVLAERAGIDAPTYGEISSTDLLRVARTMNDAAAAWPWRRVEIPQALDVVVMKERSFHVGVMVSAANVLHIERASDSVAPPLDRVRRVFAIVGFFRHEALA